MSADINRNLTPWAALAGTAGASSLTTSSTFAEAGADVDRHVHVHDESHHAEDSESDSELEQEVTLIEEGLALPPEHEHVQSGHLHLEPRPRDDPSLAPGLLDKLPIHDFEQQILDRVNAQRVSIVCGETGCGKSTVMSHFLIKDAMSRGISKPRIVVAQPRRVAAVRLAERVDAQLKALSRIDPTNFRSPNTGKRFRAGYRIMSDATTDRNSSATVLFATTGYLVSWIAADPSALDDTTHFVLDEAHERSVDMDLLLLLIKRRLAREPETSTFKVVIMSATLDVELHAKYFSEFVRTAAGSSLANLEPIDVTQRRYPVERIFLEHLLSHPTTEPAFKPPNPDLVKQYFDSYGYVVEPWASQEDLMQRSTRFHFAASGIAGATYLPPNIDDAGFRLGVALALEMGGINFQKVLPGSPLAQAPPLFPYKSTTIIVFLPGENEILAFLETLEEAMTYYVDQSEWTRIRTHVLHSSTAREEQDRAFVPADKEKGEVKIVLATNIAESSITMPDAEYVIDYGLRRAMEFNPQRGMQQLSLGWISKASFKQRSGRIGRCSPGLYVGLYTQSYLEKVMKDHEPPEISQITLEGVVLRVKETFAGERARELLNELVEPPSDEQLVAAFAKLKENGALLPLPAEARKAIRKAVEVPGADFVDPRKRAKHAVVDPEVADAVDAEEGIVTFLGRVFPTVGAELNQVRLLLLAPATGCATEGAILAACLSAQDCFLQPVPTFIKDRDELQQKLGQSFGGRLVADGGSLSEPIGLMEVFQVWMDTPPKERRGLLYAYALHQQRFRHFRALCSTFALRLSHVLEKHVLLADGKGGRNPRHAPQGAIGLSAAATTEDDVEATKLTINKLRALAKVAYETDWQHSDRLKLYEDLGVTLAEEPKEGEVVPMVPVLFGASRDQLRALVLASCVPNVFHGRPQDTTANVMQSAAMKLEKHRRWALGLGDTANKKVDKAIAEKLLPAEQGLLFGGSNKGDEAFWDANNIQLGYLRKFAYGTASDSFSPRPLGAENIVPGLAPKKGAPKINVNPPVEVSFANTNKLLTSFRARYRDLDHRHTVVITLTEKCPQSLKSAGAIRSALAWLGADRATMCQVEKGRKVFPAVVVEFDPSASYNAIPTNLPEGTDLDSIFIAANQSGYGARAAFYLCMGRNWAMALPLPPGSLSKKPALQDASGLQSTAMNLGQDVGTIALPGALLFTSANPVHSKMQLRPYWRSPSIAGLGTFLLNEPTKDGDDPEAQPKDATDLAKQLQSPIKILHKQRGQGRPTYLIAGSTMIVSNESTNARGFTNPGTLNLTTSTLIPADEPSWNLRLLAFSPDPAACYLRLEDAMNASAIRHPFWHSGQSDGPIPDLVKYQRKMLPAGMPHDGMLLKEMFGEKGRTMRREQLEVVNAVRAGVRNLLIRGVGLSTAGANLGDVLFGAVDEAGRAIVARGLEDKVELGKSPGKGVEPAYWSKLSPESDDSTTTGLEQAMSSSSLEPASTSGLPSQFAFTFNASPALHTSAGDSTHAHLPEPALLAIEKAFLPPLVWPKWDPPKPAFMPGMRLGPTGGGFGGFGLGGGHGLAEYDYDSEDDENSDPFSDTEDEEDSDDY